MTPPAPALARAAAPAGVAVPHAAVDPQDGPYSAPVLRVGGMAFGNGVLMRSRTHWAWARDDGTMLQGVVPARFAGVRWLRLPVLRSVVAFLEMVTLSVRLHRHNGARRGARLLLWLAVMVVVSLGVSAAVHSLVHPQLVADLLVQSAGLLLALVVLQLGMGAEVWRYHGAEHKAVNAYEARADLRDTKAVAAFSRIHDRCGTNLVLVVFVLALLYVPLGASPIGQALSLAGGVLVIAAALEFFRLLERRPRWVVSRAVLTCGRTMQRLLTTRDPGPEHLALACAALRRVVELESSTS